MEPRWVLLWGLEAGGWISPRSLAEVFVFVAAAAAASDC